MSIRSTSGQSHGGGQLLRAPFMSPRPLRAPISKMKTINATASDIPRRLVTPMVTLSVGREGQRYYAHEGILCSLKHFQDILEGPLKTAPEKVITMPEDSKEAALALVEYLYSGKYHFQASLENKSQETQPQDAPTSIVQMEFHVEVYKIAKKYQHQDLLVASHTEVVNVMKGSRYDLDINILRLWKIVYSVPVMSIVDNRDFYTVGEWIRSLLREHRDELRDFFQEYPEFACGISEILTRQCDFMIQGFDRPPGLTLAVRSGGGLGADK